MVLRLEAKMRRLAPGPEDQGVFLVHAVRSAWIGQVRYPRQDLVSELGGVGLLPQRRLDARGQILQLCEFLGARLAPGGLLLLGAQRLSVLGVPTPARVRREQLVEVLARPAPRQRGPEALRILPCRLKVNHLRDSSRAASAPFMIVDDSHRACRKTSTVMVRRVSLRGPARILLASRRSRPPGAASAWWPGPSRPGWS